MPILQMVRSKPGVSASVRAIAAVLLLSLASCSSLGTTGPTSASISGSQGVLVANARVKIVDVNDFVARRVAAAYQPPLFSQALGDAAPTETVIGAGDILQVTVWEAPPAVLFGGSTGFGSGAGNFAGGTVGEHSDIPEMMVDENGEIRLPFAGVIHAAGRTPQEVERIVRARLTDMAHDPQVAVRISRNTSATVAVVGDVANSGRVAITPRGERLLDVIASAGGVTKPVGKVSVQVARAGTVVLLPLDRVLRDTSQNIRLAPDDVVSILFQPFSFTALGATSTSAEIPFESTGLTLAEALGRVGGLKEDRANARGVYIFRFEDPSAVDAATAATSPRTADGRIPIIYRVDLRNPATLFAA
jgi:polysaccharide export outer membrane protein